MSYKDKAGKSSGDEIIIQPTGPYHWPELRCRADGCPNAWAVHVPDRDINHLCSKHAWSDPKYWPSITDNILRGVE